MDFVRIALKKNTFDKGTQNTQNFSSESFRVSQMLEHKDPIMYRLKSLGLGDTERKFYREELQSMHHSVNKIHGIEATLDEKKVERNSTG